MQLFKRYTLHFPRAHSYSSKGCGLFEMSLDMCLLTSLVLVAPIRPPPGAVSRVDQIRP